MARVKRGVNTHRRHKKIWCIEKKRLHKFLKKLNKRKLVNQKPIAVSTDHRLFEKLVH